MKQIRDAWASSSDIVRTTLVICVAIVIIVGILYGRTYLVVTPTTPSEEMDVNTHGD